MLGAFAWKMMSVVTQASEKDYSAKSVLNKM